MKTVDEAVLPAGISLVKRPDYESSWRIMVSMELWPFHLGNLELGDGEYEAVISWSHEYDHDPVMAIKKALESIWQHHSPYAPTIKAMHAFGVLPDPAALRGLLDSWEAHRRDVTEEGEHRMGEAMTLSQCYRDLNHIPGVSAPGQTPPPTVESGVSATTPVGGVDHIIAPFLKLALELEESAKDSRSTQGGWWSGKADAEAGASTRIREAALMARKAIK